MQITSPAFKQNTREALADAQLQKALGNVRGGFIDKRRKAIDALPEFDRLRHVLRPNKGVPAAGDRHPCPIDTL